MGNCWARIFRRRNVRRHIVLILIGLDNAGKTKTVNNLAGENYDKVLPTVGFKAVNLIHKDTPVTIYDLGGGPHFRQIWPQYYSEVHGVIFVIDSSDYRRLEECKVVLEEVLSHDKISGKPVLILANKQDKNGALDDIDVVEKLNIEPLVNKYRCPTLVESYSAVTYENSKKPKIDPGLKKGYHWLLSYIVRRYGDINLRVQTDIHADLERRKRMMNKNTASQTFTAISDDIATQTGFENPNFNPPSSAKSNEGLIIVKPMNNSNTIDTTITLESLDESDQTSSKPKLSPLFGKVSNDTSSVETKVELEQRSEFRKLSPIVKNKSAANQHIDFMNRPQSSPTFKKQTIKVEPSSKNTSFQDEELAKDMTVIYGDGTRMVDGVRTLNGPPEMKHRVFVKDSELSQMHREIVMTEREYSKTVTSDPVLHSVTLPADVARPASASQLLRKQLELSNHTHKRRLSLRYMQRNKTSPERVSMVFFEPGKSQRQLDKGDFEHTATSTN